MQSQTANELREFHRYLTERISSNSVDLSPEEALEEWRLEHPSDEAFEEDVAAIQEAIDSLAKDKGQSVAEFDRDFRKRHNIPI